MLEKFTYEKEQEIIKPIVKDVYGPNAESVNLGFRFNGNGSMDADMLRVIEKLLYNGTAGLLDIDLVQGGKVLSANAEAYSLNDYSMFFISAQNNNGQKLEDVKDLLISELEK